MKLTFSKLLHLSRNLFLLTVSLFAGIPKESPPMPNSNLEKATFGAGCFWGVEYNFRTVPGVKEAFVGYSGGKTEKPTYRDVCMGDTYHAEVVQVIFDPKVVTYRQLVDYFFRMHNPTELNCQGPDVGTQYRSVIFVHSPEQRKIAEELRAQVDASGKYKKPVVTQIIEEQPFWMAEEYHQKYFEKRGGPTCHPTPF
jgi:peptide-methionine (S)-S-oxide reductase